MAGTFLFWTPPLLRNSTRSGMVCSGGQLIAFTLLPLALCTGRPRYHPFPPSANTAVGQLPSALSAPLRKSTLPPLGYPSLSPPGTRVVQRTLIASTSEAPPTPSTLLHGLAWRLILAKHLPLDSLCHEASDLIEEISILPLVSTELVALPLSTGPCVTYQALRTPLIQSLLTDRLDISPPVASSYPYGACLTPHAFTGLPRFICGRIHQMRTGASYLAAHISWRNRDASTLCPFCEEDHESFQHAILHCPSKACPRLSHLSGVDDIGPDSPLWLSVPLLRVLAEYLFATRTGFPPAMLHMRASTVTPEPCSGSESA